MTARNRLSWIVAVFALSAAPAFAHSGHADAAGFLSGFMHPFAGLDHLLAMVAVGLWASQSGGPLRWQLPATFVSALAVGTALGIAGAAFAAIEALVVVSVLVLGGMVALHRAVSWPIALPLTGLFALAHGAAHGLEMPLAASPWTYVLGMLTATALLHGAGVAAGATLRPRLIALAGAIISLGGTGLLLSWAS